MNVEFTTIKTSAKRKHVRSAGEAIATILNSPSTTRIAFGGRTEKGRSGVALNLKTGIITGHKMEPIPERLATLVRHVPLTNARTAFDYLASGEDVLIGTMEQGVLLKWNGPGLEVYAAGDDSYH